MHALIEFAEQPEPKNLGVVAALIRSAWEDLHQNRKRLLAGKQTYLLKPRPDFDQARLFDKEEEEKLRKSREFWFRSAQTSKGTHPGKGNFHQGFNPDSTFFKRAAPFHRAAAKAK